MSGNKAVPLASAIVRTKNSARTLKSCIDSLRQQTVDVEIVVVDSGSTDETVCISRAVADRVITIAPGEFTYGRSLNVGAAAASGEIQIALSSHCVLPRKDWICGAARHLADASTLATVGARYDPTGRILEKVIVADHLLLSSHPWWGMSNHASAWKASAWRSEPFDESLAASEDKEWSLRATRHGGHIVVDPALSVPVLHRRQAGSIPYIRRVRRELVAMAEFIDMPSFTYLDAVADFFRRRPRDPFLTNGRRCGRTRLLDCTARGLSGRESR